MKKTNKQILKMDFYDTHGGALLSDKQKIEFYRALEAGNISQLQEHYLNL